MDSQEENTEIVLAERPSGALTLDAFGMRDIEMPQVAAGEILLKSLYISVDPGMRGFMDEGKDDGAGKKFDTPAGSLEEDPAGDAGVADPETESA